MKIKLYFILSITFLALFVFFGIKHFNVYCNEKNSIDDDLEIIDTNDQNIKYFNLLNN